MKTLLRILLILSLLIFINLHQNASADTLSIGVYPPLIRIQTPIGSHIQRAVVVKNYSDSPVTLNIQMKSITSSDLENGQVSFLPDKNTDSTFLAENIRILDQNRSINQVLLSPKEVKNLTLDITVPNRSSDRDYYFSILFITSEADSAHINASLIKGGLGINVLLAAMSQAEEPQGYIKSFDYPLFPKQSPIVFSVEVANQGKHFVAAKGDINIINIFTGRNIDIRLRPVDILSGSSRYLPDYTDHLFTKATWNPDLLLGVYKIDLMISLNNSITFHRTEYMYSFPFTVIFGSLIFVIFLTVIIVRIRRKIS